MLASLVIAGKDLRQRLRDHSVIAVGVIAPVAVAALMSVAFSNVSSFHYTLGVVDEDHGPVAAGLLRGLTGTSLRDTLTVRPVPSEARAAEEVRDQALGAALVIPPGFSAALAGSRATTLRTLGSVNNPPAASVTEAIASSFVAQLDADRLSVATAVAAGVPPSHAGELAAAASRLRIPERIVERPLTAHPIKAVSYYAPAMALFFLFFTISFSARSFFVDKDEGMIERMRAAPIRPVEILAGKALSVFAFGTSSLGLIAVITSVAFGADWGNPVPAAAVCLAMVTAVVCLTALVIGLSRTRSQADGISSAVVFVLAILGGNFVFISAAPPVMRTLALLTPNGWALRAFTDLATTGGGLGAVAVPLAAILAWSAAAGVGATLLARRAVTS